MKTTLGFCFLTIFFSCVLGSPDLSSYDDLTLVKTTKGLLRGAVQTTPDNSSIYLSYIGVPYAAPPIGNLRFSLPVEHPGWHGVWSANGIGSGEAGACLQVNHDPSKAHGSEHSPPFVTGSEDCLKVNVYVPAKALREVRSGKREPLPVVVHIHGGAFMFGRGDSYGPDNLMRSEDVAYVTFNYRLGPLGFLSTEDEVSPGNNGLKDQRLALRWLQKEASSFGLDKNRVTITGLSAGGASVHFHTLSKSSSGLFANAMSFSGTALAGWSMVENARNRAEKLADALGCPVQDSQQMVDCLRTRSSVDIILKGKELFQPWLYNPYTPWGPVVEPKDTEDAFLTKYPYEILVHKEANDVPWISSVTTHEGLYPAAEFLYKDHYLQELDENWDTLAKYILHYEDTIADGGCEVDLARRIKQEYIKDKISLATFPELVQLIGDRLFVAEAERAARMHSNAISSPVYFYVYGFRGSHSTSELLAKKDEDHGVCHADDVMYVLSPHPKWYTKYMVTKEDVQMRDQLVEMWTKFAHDSKATFANVNWDPVEKRPDFESGDFTYLYIERPGKAEIKKSPYLGRRPFWDSLKLHENQHAHFHRESKVAKEEL